MALMQPRYIDRFCRLCAKEHDVTITLTSPEAETLFLRDKLSKYLLVNIQEDDKLTRNVCINCVNSVQTLCNFVEEVRKAQEVLKNCSKNSEEQSLLKASLSQKPKDIRQRLTFDPSEILSYADVVTLKLIKLEEPTNNETLSDDDNCGVNMTTYTCPLCFRYFSTEASLQNHAFTHFGDTLNPKNRCYTCFETFETIYELINHLKKDGDQEMCQICNRRFTQEHLFVEHLNEHLSKTRDLCGRSYGNMSSLKTNHSMSHTNYKPLEYHNCEKDIIPQFSEHKEYNEQHQKNSSETYLQNRTHVYPGDLPIEEFKQEACKNSASQEEGILVPYDHLVNIQGVMKYLCKICHHSFVMEANFISHSYQHTNIKPYYCKLCCEKFVTFKSLQTHYLVKHKTVYKKY